MNVDALRSALAAALDALDAPDPEPVPEPVDIGEMIEAEAEADRERIAAEAEATAEVIEAEAAAEVEVIEAEAAAEVEVIEAEAAAEVEVIEADDDDDDAEPADVLDCPDDLDLGGLADELVDMIEDGADVLDGPADDAPLDIEDVPPAATHWYTRRRSFRRK